MFFSLIPVGCKKEEEENEVNDILEPGRTRVAYNNNNNHKREEGKKEEEEAACSSAGQMRRAALILDGDLEGSSVLNKPVGL